MGLLSTRGGNSQAFILKGAKLSQRTQSQDIDIFLFAIFANPEYSGLRPLRLLDVNFCDNLIC
jgi:hypothetical protein